MSLPRSPFPPSRSRRVPPLLVLLLAAGLALTACTSNRAQRGTAADAMASQDRASASEDSPSAVMRRLFSPLRTEPSGR